jgi:hypothetical protein
MLHATDAAAERALNLAQFFIREAAVAVVRGNVGSNRCMIEWAEAGSSAPK